MLHKPITLNQGKFKNDLQTLKLTLTDNVEEKTYHVSGSVFLKFEKSSEIADFRVALVVDGCKFGGLYLSKEAATAIISCLTEPTELIAHLKTMGISSTQIAEVIESNLKSNKFKP